MLRIRILVACVALFALVGGITAAMRPVPESAPRFITDAHGRSLVFHGFSTDGGAKQSSDGLPMITHDEVKAEHEDIGTNFVRLLISWRAVEPEPGVYDEEYFDRLENMIGWYEDLGYSVMLDMHQDLWGMFDDLSEGAVGNGAPGWATYTDGKAIKERDQWELHYLDPGIVRAFDHFWDTTGEHPELQEHYAGAWKAVAERFGGHPAVVAYDLMNESYGGSQQGPAFEAGALTDLYQRTTDEIRQVDDDTWVCVEPQVVGFNWGLPSALGPIDDPSDKIAFCPHIYPHPLDLGEDYTGKDAETVDSVIAGWINNTLNTSDRLGDAPIILGEFGLNTERPGALEYVDKVVSDMAGAGISSVYWSRDPGSWGPYEEDGTKRNLIDTLRRAYPRAVAGTPLSWGTEDGEFALTLLPDGDVTAPTEIFLPPEEFPNPLVRGGEIESWDPESGILEVTTPSGETPVTVAITETDNNA